MSVMPHSDGSPRLLEFEIPSDVRFIERVVEAIRVECRRLCYDDRQVGLNVPVALTEAISNAILRGNGEDRGKFVRVRAQVDTLQLVVEIIDEGAGFDLDACAVDPTTSDRLWHEDGRGLYLMRQLMDDVERLEAQGRNVIRMTLRRAS